jgi:hypothetical protein
LKCGAGERRSSFGEIKKCSTGQVRKWYPMHNLKIKAI